MVLCRRSKGRGKLMPGLSFFLKPQIKSCNIVLATLILFCAREVYSSRSMFRELRLALVVQGVGGRQICQQASQVKYSHSNLPDLVTVMAGADLNYLVENFSLPDSLDLIVFLNCYEHYSRLLAIVPQFLTWY